MPARHAAAFDTLTYAKKLEEAGFTPQQAEVQAFALADIVDERLATKEDIRRLEEVMKANRIAAEHDTALIRKDIEQIHKDIEQIHLKIEALRESTKKDIKHLETQMDLKLEAMRSSLIIWLGGIVVASAVASVGLIATLIRLGT